MFAIEIKDVVKTYKSGTKALKGVSFNVDKGDFFALLGANGAGKTTLIGILTGLVNKTSGSIKVFGHDIDHDFSDDVDESRTKKSSIGSVMEMYDDVLYLMYIDGKLAMPSPIEKKDMNKYERLILNVLPGSEVKFKGTPRHHYSAEELAEFLEFTVEDVRQSLRNNGRHVSMDAPLVEGDESSSNMYDVLSGEGMPSPENNLTMESLRSDIKRSLLTLTPRESEVICMFYGLDGRPPMSLEEIGDRFDLTRERVRQIKEKAIRRLKHTSKNKILKSYLG